MFGTAGFQIVSDCLLQAKSLAGCLFMQGTKLACYFRLKGVFQVTQLKISACSTTSVKEELAE